LSWCKKTWQACRRLSSVLKALVTSFGCSGRQSWPG